MDLPKFFPNSFGRGIGFNLMDHYGWVNVGARTLMVLRMGNSAELQEIVSGVTTQNSLRGVGVESKPSFCNSPWFKSMVL